MDQQPLSRNELKKLMGHTGNRGLNRHLISLCCIDFEVLPAEITALLQLQPSATAVKGQTYRAGSAKTIEKTHTENMWQYEELAETNEPLGQLVSSFIKRIVLPRQDLLRDMSRETEIRLQVVLYDYADNNPGLALSALDLQVLARAGCELDMDIYCLGD